MHRAAAIQCWRWRRVFALDPDVRTWTANGFFWVGNFAMAVGGTFAAGGCLVLQRLFVAGEALRLMQEERVSKLLAWPHQWARLVEDPLYKSVELERAALCPLEFAAAHASDGQDGLDTSPCRPSAAPRPCPSARSFRRERRAKCTKAIMACRAPAIPFASSIP